MGVIRSPRVNVRLPRPGDRPWGWFGGELAPELAHLGMWPGAMGGCHHHDSLGQHSGHAGCEGDPKGRLVYSTGEGPWRAGSQGFGDALTALPVGPLVPGALLTGSTV